jgi:hypothetical protein
LHDGLLGLNKPNLENKMIDLPFTFTLPMPQVIPSKVDNHIERRLSALRGQFLDQDSYAKMIAAEDRLIYEVY